MTFSIPHLSTKISEAKASIVLNTTFLLNEIKQSPHFFAQNLKKCAYFFIYPFASQIVSLNLPLGFNWNKSNNTKIYKL